jgi:hypothetical protein
LFLTFPLVLDVPTNLVGDLDRDIIKRTRDTLTNATIIEIMNEDPQSPDVFRDALRQHIVTLCLRLRISLIIVNTLMAASVALGQADAN